MQVLAILGKEKFSLTSQTNLMNYGCIYFNLNAFFASDCFFYHPSSRCTRRVPFWLRTQKHFLPSENKKKNHWWQKKEIFARRSRNDIIVHVIPQIIKNLLDWIMIINKHRAQKKIFFFYWRKKIGFQPKPKTHLWKKFSFFLWYFSP